MAAVKRHLQDSAKHSREIKIAAYYMCAQFFYAVAWFMPFFLSVGILHKILSYAFIVFLTIWAVLFAQVWWMCERGPGWKDAPLPQCDLGLNVAVAQKIRITVFSTTIATTCVSLNHAFFVLRARGLKEALAAIVQDAVSLIVAYLSVLIVYLFRIGTEEPESAPTFGTRSIITFGGSGKKRNPAITTTYITTSGKLTRTANCLPSSLICYIALSSPRAAMDH
ncbi:hypothetical protein M422DRAFT_272061 [Sphaerobolus stellatus SS14]|uniref:Uncharacterized protein n=1 Tax=Sphaerobolus stellatus (strain SS14) TaxID=990650 RepID=A0A0C9TY82_SPHS4|nr:hypothetical protein M422DRAFT_272061 [Sphaerobolus stellatus SS14]